MPKLPPLTTEHFRVGGIAIGEGQICTEKGCAHAKAIAPLYKECMELIESVEDAAIADGKPHDIKLAAFMAGIHLGYAAALAQLGLLDVGSEQDKGKSH